MFLIDHFGKELRRADAVCGVMRASIDTARLCVVVAQVAGCRLSHHLSFLQLRLRGAGFVQRLGSFRNELMQIDVAVRTVVGAYSATDAPVFDDDLERIAPPDGAHRTSHHA